MLCRSRGGREVPLLRVAAGPLPVERRPSVWVQARQHAWESGSSWVARGFGDWLLGDAEAARRLRERAEILIVPIMDVDNAATGNGGKDAVPHDHNRDWSAAPHWNETVAAQCVCGDSWSKAAATPSSISTIPRRVIRAFSICSPPTCSRRAWPPGDRSSSTWPTAGSAG